MFDHLIREGKVPGKEASLKFLRKVGINDRKLTNVKDLVRGFSKSYILTCVSRIFG